MSTAESLVHVVVFAKAPVAGRVKTRLIPVSGAQGAAQIASRLLSIALKNVGDAGLSAELCADPPLSSRDWRNHRIPATFERTEQGDGDLGQRLERAANRVLNQGRLPIFVGTDCPDLRGDGLSAAARKLQDHDCVIYPAADGGYVLLGLRRSHPALFSNINWGGSSVFAQTMKAIHQLGWSVYTGPVFTDIDRPADLAGWQQGT